MVVSFVSSPILRNFWRNLKEKIRGGRFFFRVREEGGEEECVFNGF